MNPVESATRANLPSPRIAPDSRLDDAAFAQQLAIYAASATAGLSGARLAHPMVHDDQGVRSGIRPRSPGVGGHRPAETQSPGPTELAVRELASPGEAGPMQMQAREVNSRPPRHHEFNSPLTPRTDGTVQSRPGRFAHESTSVSAQTSPPQAQRASGSPVSDRSLASEADSMGDRPGSPSVAARASADVRAVEVASARSSASQVHAARGVQSISAASAPGGAGLAQSRGDQAISARTAPSQPPRGGSHDAESLARQVGRGLANVLTRGGGSLTLRLTPASLGAVRVHVDLRDGFVRATLHATTDSARELLSQGVASLKASLETRGLKVDRLDVAPGPGTAWSDPNRASMTEATDRAWPRQHDQAPREDDAGDSGSHRRHEQASASERRDAQESASEKRNNHDATDGRHAWIRSREADGSVQACSDDPGEDARLDGATLDGALGIWRAEAGPDGTIVRLRLDAVA